MRVWEDYGVCHEKEKLAGSVRKRKLKSLHGVVGKQLERY